jgi:hypothetical protein
MPEGLWVSLFGIMLGTFVPSILRWFKGWKQQRKFYDYMKKLSSKSDLNTIDKEITELYARRKINESQH